MSKVFLSYCHKDAAWAEALSTALARKGLSLWRDTECIEQGQAITTEVSRAIDDSAGFCVLLSKQSGGSWWVQAELSAAFARRAVDPSYKLFPIRLDEESVPRILSGLLYIDGRSASPEEIAEQILAVFHPAGSFVTKTGVDWETILSAIEDDQFTDQPGSHHYGGWSKSYSQNYLPLAFPSRVPDSVSLDDSITVTHWMIRGLCCLKRLLVRWRLHPEYIHRIDTRLNLARNYLFKHFNGEGAGLIHMTATGEEIVAHVRHSAVFAKALLQLSHERPEPIRRAMSFSLFDLSQGDGRVPTFGERLHLVGVLRSRPDLWSPWMSSARLDELQCTLEEGLVSLAHTYESEQTSLELFGHEEQWHVAGYYSWWVLDACGDILRRSTNQRTLDTLSRVHSGLASLRLDLNGESSAFPLSLHGGPDLGASAHIGEVLLRLWPAAHIEDIDRLASYVTSQASPESLKHYRHIELLWAIPHFLERLECVRQEAAVMVSHQVSD